MQVGNHDQLGAAAEILADSFGINGEAIFESAGEVTDPCAEILRQAEQQLVGGLLHQDLVARLDKRGHGEMVGHGGAGRRHNAINRDAISLGQPFLQRRIAVTVGPINFQLIETHRQIRQRVALDSAAGQLVARGRV